MYLLQKNSMKAESKGFSKGNLKKNCIWGQLWGVELRAEGNKWLCSI